MEILKKIFIYSTTNKKSKLKIYYINKYGKGCISEVWPPNTSEFKLLVHIK